ncbi:MAG: DUF4157 domain-containing protein [Nannocystaceae bacterium]
MPASRRRGGELAADHRVHGVHGSPRDGQSRGVALRPPPSGVRLVDQEAASLELAPPGWADGDAASVGIVQASPASAMRLTAAGHASEREADAVAERVVGGAQGAGGRPLSIVRRPSRGDGVAISPPIERGILRARAGGSPLQPHLRAGAESALGADLSGVRVHDDAGADRLSRSLGARAFTTGRDIFFRRGAFDPSSAGGAHLLAHELTHVVQQGGGASCVQRDDDDTSATGARAFDPEALASDAAEPEARGARGSVSFLSDTGDLQAFDPEPSLTAESDAEATTVPAGGRPHTGGSYLPINDPTLGAKMRAKLDEKLNEEPKTALPADGDGGSRTLKSSRARAGKAVASSQIDALYVEKTEKAIAEDNRILQVLQDAVGEVPLSDLKPKLDAQIDALKEAAPESVESGVDTQLFNLTEARLLLDRFGSSEELDAAWRDSEWRMGALRQWTPTIRINQYVIEMLYREVESIHDDWHTGRLHLKRPEEAQIDKSAARAVASDLADEAAARASESKKLRVQVKIWKTDLIHRNRLAPTYSETFGKALKYKAPRAAMATLADFAVGIATEGTFGLKVEHDARGFGLGHGRGVRGVLSEVRHARVVGFGDYEASLKQLEVELALIRRLRDGDPTIVDYAVNLFQYADIILGVAKRILRFAALDFGLISTLCPPVAVVTGPLAALAGLASTYVSATRVGVNSIIASLRAVQWLTNDAVMGNLLMGSGIGAAVNATSSAVSVGLNFGKAEMSAAITHQPSPNALDPSGVLGSAVTQSTNVANTAASTAVSAGGALGRSLVLKEVPKNKSKPYKLHRNLRKGKIEGRLDDPIAAADRAIASDLYITILQHKLEGLEEAAGETSSSLDELDGSVTSLDDGVGDALQRAASAAPEARDSARGPLESLGGELGSTRSAVQVMRGLPAALRRVQTI